MPIKLCNDFTLVPANTKEFAIHYTTYRENVFFRQSWERRMANLGSDIPCYWITLNDKRIGGVCIKPNSLWSFFLEPPFTDAYRVLISLKRHLIKISNPAKPIDASGILPYQSEHFWRLGFQPTETRRVMIRPTEVFESVEFSTDFITQAPTIRQAAEIVQLSYESYLGKDSIGYPYKNTIEQQRIDVESYFKYNKDNLVQSASTLVFDKNNNKLVGSCLISLWEDLPLVSNIIVHPHYRGKAIGSNMLKHALTVLNEEYEVIRLFVTVGNPAESLYYNFGFLPGIEQTTFTLPKRT